uniref:Uncharacterized protein n=1 Tax=Opuntia streptacantha TaxID=393608 RepID=A0A7C8YED8_OPUST
MGFRFFTFPLNYNQSRESDRPAAVGEVACDVEGRLRMSRGGVAGVLVQQIRRGRTGKQKGEEEGAVSGRGRGGEGVYCGRWDSMATAVDGGCWQPAPWWKRASRTGERKTGRSGMGLEVVRSPVTQRLSGGRLRLSSTTGVSRGAVQRPEQQEGGVKKQGRKRESPSGVR